MPAILHLDSYDLWLEPGMQNVTALSELLKPYDARLMRNNTIKNNDAVPGVVFIGALTGCPNQPGSGIYETDETGDCGGAVHLVGAVNSTISDNYITGNADGVLIRDETAESRNNLLMGTSSRRIRWSAESCWHRNRARAPR